MTTYKNFPESSHRHSTRVRPWLCPDVDQLWPFALWISVISEKLSWSPPKVAFFKVFANKEIKRIYMWFGSVLGVCLIRFDLRNGRCVIRTLAWSITGSCCSHPDDLIFLHVLVCFNDSRRGACSSFPMEIPQSRYTFSGQEAKWFKCFFFFLTHSIEFEFTTDSFLDRTIRGLSSFRLILMTLRMNDHPELQHWPVYSGISPSL